MLKKKVRKKHNVNVEPLSDARTKLTGFFTILLVVGAAFRPGLEKALVGHALGFDREGAGFERQPLFRSTAGAIRKQIPGAPADDQRTGREIGIELSRLADAEQMTMRDARFDFGIASRTLQWRRCY